MAGRTDTFVTTLPSTVGTSPELSGSGSPEGVVPGVPGQTFVNVDNDDLYLKIAGVQAMGWKLVGKKSLPVVNVDVSVAGLENMFVGNGSPVGVIIPTTASAKYTQRDSVPPGAVWDWYDGAWH